MNEQRALTGSTPTHDGGPATWTEEQYRTHVCNYVAERLATELPGGTLNIDGSGTTTAGRNKLCLRMNVRGNNHVIRGTVILENGSTIHAHDVSGEVFVPPGVGITERRGSYISLKVTPKSWKELAHYFQIA